MADWKMITDSKNVHFNWRVRLPKAPNFERRTDFGKKKQHLGHRTPHRTKGMAPQGAKLRLLLPLLTTDIGCECR